METNFESMEKAHSIIARERVLRDLKTLARDAEGLMKVTAGDLSESAKEARARLGAAGVGLRTGGAHSTGNDPARGNLGEP